jgi:hypothetical protein
MWSFHGQGPKRLLASGRIMNDILKVKIVVAKRYATFSFLMEHVDHPTKRPGFKQYRTYRFIASIFFCTRCAVPVRTLSRPVKASPDSAPSSRRWRLPFDSMQMSRSFR